MFVGNLYLHVHYDAKDKSNFLRMLKWKLFMFSNVSHVDDYDTQNHAGE